MDVYINLFSRANSDLWPWTLLAALLGIVSIVFVNRQKTRYCCWLLGLAWCFCAYQFHFNLLSELHWIGHFFALLFSMQGFLLLVFGANESSCDRPRNNQFRIGILIMLMGMIAFLIIPAFSHRSWQSTEIFGIAPNPTCWVTIGALISLNVLRWWLLLVPAAWLLMNLGVAFYISFNQI